MFLPQTSQKAFFQFPTQPVKLQEPKMGSQFMNEWSKLLPHTSSQEQIRILFTKKYSLKKFLDQNILGIS